MRTLHRIAVVAAGLATAAVVTTARADGPSEPWSALRLNGFGTLGLTHMTDTPGAGFRRDSSQPFNDGGTRADIDSRLGLQASYTVDPRIEVVGQLVLRRRPTSSSRLDSLDWAFVSYSATPDTTIRVGRTAPDLFLLSDHLNVGFSYPWVRPNTEAYSLLPLVTVNGADVERVWDIGEVRWRAKLIGGSGGLRISTSGVNDFHFRIRSLYGGVVSREEGGLLLRATLARVHGELQNVPSIDEVDAGLASIEMLPVPQVASDAAQLRSLMGHGPGQIVYMALGAAYDAGPWLLNAEYLRFDSDLAYARTECAYVGLARRFGLVSVFGMLGATRSDAPVPSVPQWEALLTPSIGAAAAAQDQAVGAAAQRIGNTRVYQRSYSVGARWDVRPQIALKLQFDHYRVDANGGSTWGDATVDALNPNVVSATMDFVF